MGILTVIGNGLKAFAAFCGWGKQRDAELNSSSQQSNAQAKEIQNLRDKAAKAVANPDQTDIDRMTGP